MKKICKEIRKRMLISSHLGCDGNLQSCFSSVEILWALYDRVLNFNPKLINLPHDRFVLSKGQSNLALMTVLAYKNFFNKSELDFFCKFDSRIAMQADRTKFDGVIENSAGSLGHGLPLAVGIAWAAKIKNTNEKVYVLAGDGEMNEGTMWESMIFAASEKLNNLTLIIDDNDSINRMINLKDLDKKIKAFNFDVTIVDGHSIDELVVALKKTSNKPRAILAKTSRGYGSKTLMEDRSWFHRFPNKDELDKLCKEVDEF